MVLQAAAVALPALEVPVGLPELVPPLGAGQVLLVLEAVAPPEDIQAAAAAVQWALGRLVPQAHLCFDKKLSTSFTGYKLLTKI